MAVRGRGRGSAGALRERRMTIAERVVKNGSAAVDELVELTGVSAMTVYRDIEALEEAGVLLRLAVITRRPRARSSATMRLPMKPLAPVSSTVRAVAWVSCASAALAVAGWA